MKLVACALAIGLSAGGALAAAVTPYDFTGHWSGSAQVGPQRAVLFADFSGTQTFTGTFGAEVGRLLSCTVKGVQKKKVKITLSQCSDGSTIKVKGTLDPTAHTITGKFHSVKKGRVRAHGTLTLTSAGTCVPTGEDCTDPTTGGGESSVCCNGDCSLQSDGQSHACN
jgi:hypothetical protein